MRNERPMAEKMKQKKMKVRMRIECGKEHLKYCERKYKNRKSNIRDQTQIKGKTQNEIKQQRNVKKTKYKRPTNSETS